jgi:aryl-alcohol dehydrogenase-like predicted oxidoreductase
LLEGIRPIAERHGVSIAQVVIAWTISQPGITAALCGAHNPQQAAENAAAAQVSRTPEEIRAIGETVHTWDQP